MVAEYGLRCGTCGAAFRYISDFDAHMSKHPVKCERCKGWFRDAVQLAVHPCKRVPYAEDT